MTYFDAIKIVAAGAVLAGAAPVFSHVALKTPTAAAASDYQAVFVVGHGCNGSPTTAVSVQIPSGFEAARPEPKAGWAVTTQPARFVRPDGSQGMQGSEIGAAIWTLVDRESALGSANANNFILQGKLPGQPGPLWFKVRQTCELGESDWSEIPASGTSTRELKNPAVLLQVGPTDSSPHHPPPHRH